MIERLLYGTLAIVAGTLMLKYNFQLVGLTGRLDWIESKLGSGTTYLAYKLMAVVIILGAILYITGWGDEVLTLLLSPIINIFQTS
jgi:hypothetical protein